MKKVYKAKNRILVVFSVVLLISAIIFGSYAVAKTVMTKGAFEYLQDKYEMTEEQLDILDYETGRYHLVSTDWIFEPFKIEWHNYKWQFEYNGREFFVNRINGRYYDDYQLDDIQLWATEWLSKNVDENIIGIRFDSSNLINYQLNYSNKILITKENVMNFFNDACTYDYSSGFFEYGVGIYIDEVYYSDMTRQENEYILSVVKNKLPNSKFEFLTTVEENRTIKSEYKYSNWFFEYRGEFIWKK